MEITIKRLYECTLEQAVQAWNEGFEGYFVDMKFDVEFFTRRMALDGLSPRLSLVAFADGEPAGIVMIGIRNIGGKKIATNSGTGVATRFRGTGVSRKLMEAMLDVYREEGTDLARLEAITENERAIALYKKYGYEVTGNVTFLQREEAFTEEPFVSADASAYRARRELPIAVSKLPFYDTEAAWQCQWQNLQGSAGESLLIEDADGETVGYALFKRLISEAGEPLRTILFQLEVKPGRADEEAIKRFALHEVFGPYDQTPLRMTFNLNVQNETVVRLLQEAGFKESSTQVLMERVMEKVEVGA